MGKHSDGKGCPGAVSSILKTAAFQKQDDQFSISTCVRDITATLSMLHHDHGSSTSLYDNDDRHDAGADDDHKVQHSMK